MAGKRRCDASQGDLQRQLWCPSLPASESGTGQASQLEAGTPPYLGEAHRPSTAAWGPAAFLIFLCA
ncbi:hypothetical protein WJX74_009713 [Apatococcus lobatus]|uniref:Uncharacterized protein n=1 Tax=Apatococcus lobatus TaxID=904363 RepID=A0AAW1QZX6_9CHLO